LRDDLYNLHRELAQEVLQAGDAEADHDIERELDAWVQRNATAIERAKGMLDDIKATRVYDTTTLPVALREVRNLIQGGGSPAQRPPVRTEAA
jgi:glutamate dehydrogenase